MKAEYVLKEFPYKSPEFKKNFKNFYVVHSKSEKLTFLTFKFKKIKITFRRNKLLKAKFISFFL